MRRAGSMSLRGSKAGPGSLPYPPAPAPERPAGLGWEMAQRISSLSSGKRRAENGEGTEEKADTSDPNSPWEDRSRRRFDKHLQGARETQQPAGPGTPC